MFDADTHGQAARESVLTTRMLLVTFDTDPQRRAGESVLTSVSDIATMAVEAICGLHLLTHDDTPYFVFGHELGALVAFEICRRVQAEFPVKALFVSGMSCPQVEYACSWPWKLRHGPQASPNHC